jgi:hypothetical protein
MNINHSPLFDTAKIEAHYSEKDGVPVKYVCTSATNEHAANAADIFYRAEPHPEFGNRYFGLYYSTDTRLIQKRHMMITNADMIETLEFGMIEGPEGWEYSQHRHDYRTVGDCAVDGGRSYFKRVGNLSVTCKFMKVVNGEFVDVQDS